MTSVSSQSMLTHPAKTDIKCWIHLRPPRGWSAIWNVLYKVHYTHKRFKDLGWRLASALVLLSHISTTNYTKLSILTYLAFPFFNEWLHSNTVTNTPPPHCALYKAGCGFSLITVFCFSFPGSRGNNFLLAQAKLAVSPAYNAEHEAPVWPFHFVRSLGHNNRFFWLYVWIKMQW